MSTMNAIPAAVLEELAPTGSVRAAINFGNPVLAQQDPGTGEARGVSVDLAREMGHRLGVDVQLVTFDAAGKVFEALKAKAWDVAFLAVDPKRATEIEFTAPYVIIEGSYMVRRDSPLMTIDEVDQDGVRVAVAQGSAYELYLSRTLQHAKVVFAPTGNEAIGMFRRDGLEAVAGVKSPLIHFARAHPDMRVMDGRFMVIEQAVGVPRGRAAAAHFLRALVEELKRSGFVAGGLERSGQHDARVAPAAAT
jgi:polar amino acid transport system substrate-binding protein